MIAMIGSLYAVFLYMVLLALYAGEFFNVWAVLCIIGCLAVVLASMYWMPVAPPRNNNKECLNCGISRAK